MGEILTTKQMAEYLKLHEITIAKYAAEGIIPAMRVGRVWRYDRDVVDKWIRAGLKQKKSKRKR